MVGLNTFFTTCTSSLLQLGQSFLSRADQGIVADDIWYRDVTVNDFQEVASHPPL